NGHWVNGWSADGRRFLTTVQTVENSPRIAWLNADGTGGPEFLSPDGEIAYGGRLSPDGRRLLYVAGPQPPKGQRARVRLYAMDLASKKRSAVDEPGETYGYCWSRDGSRIGYTWQRTLAKPEEVPERETLLITCSAAGGDRKTVTSRKV